MKPAELKTEIAAYLRAGFTFSQIGFVLNRERGETLTADEIEIIGLPIQDEIIAERRRDAARKAAATRRAKREATEAKERERQRRAVESAIEQKRKAREAREEQEAIERLKTRGVIPA